MSFVAHSYEQFADDLIISLTGGIAREEHEFVGGEGEIYHFTKSAVIPESVKVVGQRDGKFIQFAREVDFRFQRSEDGLLWLPDGRWPDLRSYFYVAYEQEGASRKLTNRNIGGPTATLAAAFAKQYAVFHQQLKLFYDAAFIETAKDSALDQIAALLSLRRKDARFAIGEVLFSRSTAAPADITIAAGTLVSSKAGQDFVTTAKSVLRRGQLSVAVPVRAVVEGTSGKNAAGELTVVNRPIFGIDSCVNERATFFANERETDEAFRSRIVYSLERAGRSTVSAIRYALIEALPEISEANLEVIEHKDQPGRVDVRLAISDYDARFVERVEAAIFESRPAGVVVRHNLRLTSGAGSDGAPAEALADYSSNPVHKLAISHAGDARDSALALRIDVAIGLDSKASGVAQRETLQDEIRARLADYIQNVPLGKTVIYNRLVGLVMQLDKVSDVNLSLSVKGKSTTLQSNLSAEGMKVVIDPADIHVRLMLEAIRLDIFLTLKAQANSDLDSVPNEVHDALRLGLEDLLGKAQGSLETRSIKKHVTSLLSEAQAGFLLGDQNPVVVHAEYEELGMRIANAETISLDSHQRAFLRQFDIELPGVLDG